MEESKLPEAKITPLEIEEGQVPSTEAVGGAHSTAKAGKQQKGVCQRHRGKFICLGLTLTLLAAAGIAAAVLLPKPPKVTLVNESVLSIDLLGVNTAKMVLRVDNPNRYAISFSNLEARIYDFDNVYIGTVSRPERMVVPARGSALMTATGTFPTSFELGRVGLDCLDDNKTRIKIDASTNINLANRQFRYRTRVNDNIPCLAQNVRAPVASGAVGGGAGGAGGAGAAGAAGGAGAGGAAAPASGTAAPTLPQAVGNAINQGINQIFGGGGGGGGGGGAAAGGAAGGAAPGAAAPVPGAPAT